MEIFNLIFAGMKFIFDLMKNNSIFGMTILQWWLGFGILSILIYFIRRITNTTSITKGIETGHGDKIKTNKK